MKKNLSNKEVLIAFCNTLSEANAQKAYKLLSEEFEIRRPIVIKLTRDGVEDKVNGKVRLRKQDKTKIIETLGEKYYLLAVQIMYDYIAYLESKAPYEAEARRKVRNLKTRNHFIDLTRGWVAEKIDKDYKATLINDNNTLDFYTIETISEAREFIRSVPNHLRFNNPEINFLTTKYPQLLEEEL